MEELLNTYSVSEILIFAMMLFVAIKGVTDAYDWVKGKISKVTDRELQKRKKDKDIEIRFDVNSNDIQKILKHLEDSDKKMETLTKSVQMLIDSDKDDIKAWITEQHHYFCYKLKAIDDYRLDTVEKRYSHYVAEGGNSFIETLMEEISRLPKISVTETVNKDSKK